MTPKEPVYTHYPVHCCAANPSQPRHVATAQGKGPEDNVPKTLYSKHFCHKVATRPCTSLVQNTLVPSPSCIKCSMVAVWAVLIHRSSINSTDHTLYCSIYCSGVYRKPPDFLSHISHIWARPRYMLKAITNNTTHTQSKPKQTTNCSGK